MPEDLTINRWFATLPQREQEAIYLNSHSYHHITMTISYQSYHIIYHINMSILYFVSWSNSDQKNQKLQMFQCFGHLLPEQVLAFVSKNLQTRPFPKFDPRTKKMKGQNGGVKKTGWTCPFQNLTPGQKKLSWGQILLFWAHVLFVWLWYGMFLSACSKVLWFIGMFWRRMVIFPWFFTCFCWRMACLLRH